MVADSVVVEDGVVVKDSGDQGQGCGRGQGGDKGDLLVGKQSIRKIASRKWMTFAHFVSLGLITK